MVVVEGASGTFVFTTWDSRHPSTIADGKHRVIRYPGRQVDKALCQSIPVLRRDRKDGAEGGVMKKKSVGLPRRAPVARCLVVLLIGGLMLFPAGILGGSVDSPLWEIISGRQAVSPQPVTGLTPDIIKSPEPPPSILSCAALGR